VYKFDWVELTRNGIIGIVQQSLSVIPGPLPVMDFHKRVIDCLKKHIPIRVSKKFVPNALKAGQVAISGYYHLDHDAAGNKPIELIFFYHSQDDHIKLNRKRINNIGALAADTILHEIIHMSQFRKKNFLVCSEYRSYARRVKTREAQEYLGKFDEIDAYAFNIVDELADRFGTDRSRIVAYINSDQRYRRQRNNSWLIYIRAFEHDHNHPVIRRLKKRVVKYLDRIHTGRPYDVNPWLTSPK
jgi:hypothetical protein